MVKIGVVVSEYNPEITGIMERVAYEHIKFLGGEVKRKIRVAGTLDTPIMAKHLAEDEEIKGVVVLGAVIEGDTDHDSIVAQNTVRKLVDISVESRKPIGIGISGPKMTRLEGLKRAEGYAKRAVESVFKSLKELAE